MELHEQTWTELDSADREFALVPVGSTEQHGPHGPMGTDFLAAQRIATETAERVEEDLAVTPPVPVGVSEEHRQFTGTLWVSPDTFRSYVREIVESLLHHGFSRIVLVNGHGGNVPALGEVASRVSRANEAIIVPFTWFDAAEAPYEMGHAGPLETAFLLHTFPELVREDQLRTGAEGGADRWGEWACGQILAHDSAEFTENGTVGDPTLANAEDGAALLDGAVDALSTLLEALAERPLQKPPHK
ncbi:MAG: creatininase family protein [Halodesulfurarchaeum sp.]